MNNTTEFIKTIGALAKNEYMSRDKWVLPSVCIAQAALESGWNLNAKTLFGIKGKGFTATTSEYYNGHMVQIQDSFRAYPDAASAVVGYYDFLRDTPRYAGVINNSDYKDAVNKLIHTTDGLAYATDPNYISKIISIIEKYNLTQYDVREATKSVDEVAKEVINGVYGNGEVRRDNLAAAGYDYATVQARVNEILGVTVKQSDPTNNTYTVVKGDSLWKIASDKLGNGSRYTEIKSLNGLTSDTIYAGQVLKLPN